MMYWTDPNAGEVIAQAVSLFNPYTTTTNNIGQKYNGSEYRYQ